MSFKLTFQLEDRVRQFSAALRPIVDQIVQILAPAPRLAPAAPQRRMAKAQRSKIAAKAAKARWKQAKRSH